ncbi:MAG: TFIIB-type zinc finger domain-containing protein, partial [Crenarchaeota archaeon]|nr:TFIIB-type zinc finger domain-containing protein [Thermoproteota archaeon]
MMEVRCPACRSYDVALHEGRTYGRVRFKCRRCGLSFSFALTLPSYKENGKRLSAYEKALIRADHKLGATYSQIQAEYDITRRTVSQIIHGERDVRLLYVWRTFSYQRMWPRLRRLKYKLWGDRLRLLMLEELEKGFLRQGWGFPEMDLRNGEKAFSESWRRYNLRLNDDRIERFLSAVERALSESDWFSEILDEYEEDLDEEKLTRLRQALDTLRSLGRDLRPTTYRGGEDLTRVFNALKVMLAIKPGDYVIVFNLPHSKAFTLVEVVAGY